MLGFLAHVIGSGAVTVLLLFIIKRYIVEWTKHEFDVRLEEVQQRHREILEKMRPLTAEETLRRENYLNSKLKAYYEAIELLLEMIAAHRAKPSTSAPSVSSAPGEFNINSCTSKMALFSDDPEILKQFWKCIQTPSPADIAVFISMLRKDLGYGQLVIKPEHYVYIFGDS